MIGDTYLQIWKKKLLKSGPLYLRIHYLHQVVRLLCDYDYDCCDYLYVVFLRGLFCSIGRLFPHNINVPRSLPLKACNFFELSETLFLVSLSFPGFVWCVVGCVENLRSTFMQPWTSIGWNGNDLQTWSKSSNSEAGGWCIVHTTVLPCLASCFSNLTHCTVVTVSSPLVGSSKKNTGGLFTSSSAMDNLGTKSVCFKTMIVTDETDGFFRGKSFLMPVDVCNISNFAVY